MSGLDLSTAELSDPSTGTWSTTGSMGTARSLHASAPLPGGKVLVSGGEAIYTSSAEIFDPSAGTWSTTGAMATARSRHIAVKLPGSDIVLIAGGNTSATVSMTATAELYNPTAGTWSSTVSLNTARSYHAAVVLGDGVLVTGGYLTGAPANTLASTEIYDPL